MQINFNYAEVPRKNLCFFYQKTIVIVDLNNVAYINDNYGHQEGDNVIKEAANILIKTQVDNSEIKNEFLKKVAKVYPIKPFQPFL